MTSYDRLPPHMRGAARDYIERGWEPGGFLTAVLENDLAGAFGRADSHNLHAMHEWVKWLCNDIPARAWGSTAAVEAWCAKGGLNGLEARP